MPDFEIHDHGSIVLISPITNEAQDWCDEHLPEDAQWLGGGCAVEWRYADAIIEGILGDGLTVQ